MSKIPMIHACLYVARASSGARAPRENSMKDGIGRMEAQHKRTFSFTSDCAFEYLMMIQSSNRPILGKYLSMIEEFKSKHALARRPKNSGPKKDGQNHNNTTMCISVIGLDVLTTNESSFLSVMDRFNETCVELMFWVEDTFMRVDIPAVMADFRGQASSTSSIDDDMHAYIESFRRLHDNKEATGALYRERVELSRGGNRLGGRKSRTHQVEKTTNTESGPSAVAGDLSIPEEMLRTVSIVATTSNSRVYTPDQFVADKARIARMIEVYGELTAHCMQSTDAAADLWFDKALDNIKQKIEDKSRS